MKNGFYKILLAVALCLCLALSLASCDVIKDIIADYTGEECGHEQTKTVTENEVAATCSAEGSYDEVVYCTECDEEISRTKRSIEKEAHTPGTPVSENEVDATCTSAGSYDEVVYCSVGGCGA